MGLARLGRYLGALSTRHIAHELIRADVNLHLGGILELLLLNLGEQDPPGSHYSVG